MRDEFCPWLNTTILLQTTSVIIITIRIDINFELRNK